VVSAVSHMCNDLLTVSDGPF